MNNGGTPLYIASQHGHTEVVAKLLSANANVNQAADNHATPMCVACVHGFLNIVQLLSSYGARRTFDFDPPDDTAGRTWSRATTSRRRRRKVERAQDKTTKQVGARRDRAGMGGAV